MSETAIETKDYQEVIGVQSRHGISFWTCGKMGARKVMSEEVEESLTDILVGVSVLKNRN